MKFVLLLFLLTIELPAFAGRVCDYFPLAISVRGASFEKVEIMPQAWSKGPAFDVQNYRVYRDMNSRKWCVAEVTKPENFDCEKNNIDLVVDGKAVGQIQINRDSGFFEVVSVDKTGKPDRIHRKKIRGYVETENQKLRVNVKMGMQVFEEGNPIGQYRYARSWIYDSKGDLKLERLSSPLETHASQKMGIVGQMISGQTCNKAKIENFAKALKDPIRFSTPSPNLDPQR